MEGSLYLIDVRGCFMNGQTALPDWRLFRPFSG